MTLFLCGLALVLVAGAVPLAVPGRAGAGLFAALAALGCAAAAVPALGVLLGGPEPSLAVPSSLPGGAWLLAMDPLSAWFVVLVASVGAASAVYGAGSLAGSRHPGRVALSHFALGAMIAAMALVVTAHSAVPLLVAWEVMALAGYVLIVFDSEDARVRRAGVVYLVTTHAATLALMAMFGAWAGQSQDLGFGALAASAPLLPAGGALVLALALLGFGSKAGLVPVHFWLPDAHAGAPSHVSALLSGVMIKMGIYGLLRVTSLVGTPPAWWGWTLLGLGLSSGVLGVLWALAQHDLKRLLAYHSVENVGIILLGMGAGSLGATYHAPGLAVLGYAGALLHTLNHGLFKSLLFLGAGAVGHSAGTRTIGRLGGLARRMPWTWGAFLVGSAAIVGLPPFNGFVGEWVIFQAFLAGPAAAGAVKALALGAAGLGLIGALALACFAKVGGTVFLGHPRGPGAQAAREVGRAQVAPQLGLAAACVLLGLVPALAVVPALRAAAALAGVSGAAPAPAVLRATAPLASISGFMVALVALAAALAWARRALLSRREVLRAETWGCGFPRPTPRMQTSASSFASPLLNSFMPMSGVRVERTASTYEAHAEDPVFEMTALPLWHRIRTTATRLRWMQGGKLSWYLLYVVGTLAAALAYIALAGGAP